MVERNRPALTHSLHPTFYFGGLVLAVVTYLAPLPFVEQSAWYSLTVLFLFWWLAEVLR